MIFSLEINHDKNDIDDYNDILYKKVQCKIYNLEFKALCLPQWFVRALLTQMHSIKNLHLSASQAYALIKTVFWTKDLLSMCQQARDLCLACLYSFQTKRRRSYGGDLLHKRMKAQGNFLIESDLIFLARDKETKIDTLLTAIDPVSQYFVALPIRNKKPPEIIRVFTDIFSLWGIPAVVKMDAGSEWISKKVQQFFKQHAVEPHFSALKNSLSYCENSNKLWKNIL